LQDIVNNPLHDLTDSNPIDSKYTPLSQADEELKPLFEEVGQGRLKGKSIRTSVLNYLKDEFGTKPRETPNAVLSLGNKFGNLGRMSVFANPSGFIYHQLHNLLPNLMLAGLNPMEAIRALATRGDNLKELMSSEPTAQYARAGGEVNSLAHEFRNNGQSPLDVLRNTVPQSGLKAKATGALNAQKNMVLSADLRGRLALFDKFKQQGYSVNDARKMTEKYLFANKNYSSFEKNYSC